MAFVAIGYLLLWLAWTAAAGVRLRQARAAVVWPGCVLAINFSLLAWQMVTSLDGGTQGFFLFLLPSTLLASLRLNQALRQVRRGERGGETE
ncbi:hypothetical protein GL263_19080 [Streptomyces durbertensis]|uniref:Uncharacterized protein n=2 Tax=Streptomyces durbertensis TaxID=2448886 RepID=A0ABR6EJY3_9ACTN|nr:hypothetical protein [Streptomyces durbertensis]